jgi:rSAM/selenodomain-associated transferase 1
MKKALICFTRVPKPGATKTRLLGVLTPEQCARLHWAFLKDLAKIYPAMDADLFVSHTPDPDWIRLAAVFPYASGYFPQEGADLGEKMHNAMAKVLAMGYEYVILTGTDLPLMTEKHLKSGFSALEKADVTIGPNPDGGYYLIGMKKPHPDIFHVPNYGGATVYENTAAAVRAAGLSCSPALACGDVDTPHDLQGLVGIIDPNSATARCLAEFQKEGVRL